MYPETMAMLIQPVAAHTGLRSGLILPDYTEIELQASDKHEALLSVDGFTDTLLHGEDRVSIRRSPYTTRFLRRHAPHRVLRRPHPSNTRHGHSNLQPGR